MAKPRFQPFQKVGQFMVIKYVDHTNINPRNGRVMVDDQHWYRVRCSCGAFEFRSQQELRDIRRRQMCAECRKTEDANYDSFAEMARKIAREA
jgi:hypothetical protein